MGRSYNGVAEAKHYLGKHEEALALHELALNIFKNKYGFEHPEVAETFELIGVTYIGMEEIEDRAIPYLMESVKIRKKTQGETQWNHGPQGISVKRMIINSVDALIYTCIYT